MSEYLKDGDYHLWFDSTQEMQKELPALMARANSGNWNRDVRGGYGWLGCPTVAEAVRHIDHGWPELLQSITPKVESIRHSLELDSVTPLHVEVRRRKRHRGDYGDTLDMHRVWSGQLDTAWERPVKEHRLSSTERYATIYSDLWVLAVVTPEQTIWRAAAIHAIVDTLTRMGINTEVWSGGVGHDSYYGRTIHSCSFAVRVKEFAQPLNDERLAAVSHVAFFRTYGFGMINAAPSPTNSGLGRPTGSGMVKPLKERAESGERVFRIGNVFDLQSALLEVRRVVEELKPKRQEVA